MTLLAEWHIEEPRLRVTEADGRAALRAITGQPVIPARARPRFGPGRPCDQARPELVVASALKPTLCR